MEKSLRGLPLQKVITKTELVFRFCYVAVIYFSLYLINNRFQCFSPLNIPQTQIDQLVPFAPWGIYIYIAAYIQPTMVFIRLYYQKNFGQLIILQNHFLLTTIFANIIFFFFPTTITMPYSSYTIEHLSSLSSPLTAHLLQYIYSTDRPFNCLPSLHVAASFVATYSLHQEKKHIILLSYFFSFAVALSTLMVKQHIFYDLVFGFILSILVMPLAKLWSPQKIT